MLCPATMRRASAKAGDTPIMIALSGGGDSTALLHLLVGAFGAGRFQALIVDHALREGSRADASRALSFAAGLGVEGQILTLNWPKGPKRAQKAARRARFAALCDMARKQGARVIALAHTADDQAETVLMRAAAGSGWRGLAGMAAFAPAPVWPEGRGICLARPLLGVRRAVLRKLLRARRADWIEDPANANPAFERVRTRARLAAFEAQGFDPMDLSRVADGLRIHKARADRDAAALINRAARFEGQRIRVDCSMWAGDDEVRRRALSVLVMAAAGSERPPEASAIGRLEAAITGIESPKRFAGATLAGAALTPEGGEIVVGRDPGALLGRADGAAGVSPMALRPGETAVWDGRLSLAIGEPGWSVAAAGDGAPMLRRGGVDADPFSVCAAARWLLKDHVEHLIDGD